MAKSARQTVFEGMELLQTGLRPFVEQRLKSSLGETWKEDLQTKFRGSSRYDDPVELDNLKLLQTIEKYWNDIFRTVLDRTHRSIVVEIQDVRNKLAHDQKFSYDDAERALDSMRRLLEAVSAGESGEEVARMRDGILRTKYRELARAEERKTDLSTIATDAMAGLLPWRQVVEPHQDVATGEFQQAEFAADLAKVHEGSAPFEYRDPKEFFSRTYLTDGLSLLLEGAAKRLSGVGGDPVVELQTNFGGGKTHSMLALYHMAGETPVSELPGLDQLLATKELGVPANINRAVLVGTSRGPLNPVSLGGGRKIRTTWGELAWQLGGEEAFSLLAENDEKGIAPGSALLEELFTKTAPNLILIDEWVAYLRQIYKQESLPSGTFDANISFVQSLTEAVKTSPQTLLVASLPASQIEVGGEGGQEALARLKQTFSRVESSWRPASQEESYEIVRRRLFKDVPGDRYSHRDNTVKQFAKLYRENPNDFPQGCAEEDYRRKLEKAYPIHPDLFDNLYTAWGSLEKFQRTRGVLRLMAQVIHELWMANDSSVMIMPGSVAVSSARVEPELLHYLPPTWQSIIGGDVDGTSSIPFQIDQSVPNLNKYSATRRVARTIFMATAPTAGHQNPGVDDKQVHLGVVQPGERIATFGDALRRLSNQAMFMHSDQSRYWYSESPSLNRMANDRSAQVEEAKVVVEIDKALVVYINSLRTRGHFDAVQVAPEGSGEVPDEGDGVRVVVLGVNHPHTGRNSSEAFAEVKDIVLQRGSTPRVYRNSLVFLTPEKRSLEYLKDAMRAFIAWQAIERDAETGRLDLKASDVALVRDKVRESKNTLDTRLRESWCYLIYPYQESPQVEMELSATRVTAQDNILERASKKLVSEEALLPELGPSRLNRDLEKYIWHDKEHIYLKDVWEYLNRYTYLPRIKGRETLMQTVNAAISGLIPGPFAYAERWDDEKSDYQGLAIDQASNVRITIDSDSLLVRPEAAERHRPQPQAQGNEEATGGASGPQQPAKATGGNYPTPPSSSSVVREPPHAPVEEKPKRFLGTVMLSADRPSRDMHQIVEAIIEQLTTLPKAEVTLKLEIDGEIPGGLDKAKVRTLLENSKTLGFIDKSVQ